MAFYLCACSSRESFMFVFVLEVSVISVLFRLRGMHAVQIIVSDECDI